MKRKPKLSPPCWNWEEDLSAPDEPPGVIPDFWNERPNHLDEVFLELSRTHLAPRGFMIWLLLGMAVNMIFGWWIALGDRELIQLLLLFTPFLLWLGLSMWKTEVETPRDMPLRFNRARQRLYAYNFVHKAWNPFERWRVVPVAYDWSQVRAERWLASRAYNSAGITLSIIRPGSNEVVDRFSLTDRGMNAHTWAYVCTYMQQGPDALPPPDPPRNHNDVPWYNAALLLAPKVNWPAEMDHESRTAP